MRTLLLFTLLATVPTAALADRLVSEQVLHTTRICTYRGYLQDRNFTVPATKSCPGSLEDALGKKQRVVVPAFARLARQGMTKSGKKACVYAHQGKEYVREVPATGHCSLTR